MSKLCFREYGAHIKHDPATQQTPDTAFSSRTQSTEIEERISDGRLKVWITGKRFLFSSHQRAAMISDILVGSNKIHCTSVLALLLARRPIKRLTPGSLLSASLTRNSAETLPSNSSLACTRNTFFCGNMGQVSRPLSPKASRISSCSLCTTESLSACFFSSSNLHSAALIRDRAA